MFSSPPPEKLIHGHALEMDDTLNTNFKKRLYELLHSPALDYIMSLTIFVNFGLIIAETNRRAQEFDNDIPKWMDVSSWSILVLFVLELVGRMYVTRIIFFRDPWNIFDLIIIFTDLIFSCVAEIFSSFLPISLLRILRMAKICRISKVFKLLPELRLMVGGLIGAMRAILWGSVLMVIAMLFCAVVAVQFIHPLNKELAEQGVYDGCYDCKDKFSSVQYACVTFWQQILAGDSWGQVTLPIIYAYPATFPYFAFVFLLLAVALQNLILGVIVDVAQDARKRMQQDTEREQVVLRMEQQTHLLHMCRAMDSDGDGQLTKEELFKGFTDNYDFHQSLQDLDVQQADLDVVWLLLDKDKSGTVDYDEFVNELYNLRSSESQFMITYIKYYVTVIKDHLLDKMQRVEDGMKAVERRTVKVVENMERRRTMYEDGIQVVEDGVKAVDREVKAVEDLERQRLLHSGEENSAGQSRVGTKEVPNASGRNSDGAKLQEGNGNCGMERPIHHVLEEIRQSGHRVTAMLEALDAKVEFSLQEQLQRTRGSLSRGSLDWSLGLPCQSVYPWKKMAPQTPADSWQHMHRVLGRPHISGPDAPQWSTHDRHEGDRRWH